jgi:hypothetical protein
MLEHFNDFLDADDLRVYLRGELMSIAGYYQIDDPMDFINGMTCALSYMLKSQFKDKEDRVQFKISLAIWLRRVIDDYEHII